MNHNVSSKFSKIIPLYIGHKDNSERVSLSNSIIKKKDIIRDKLCIVNKDQVIVLDQKDIIFCHADGNYTMIHTSSGH